MDELINLVTKKTGLSQKQATQAVETVLDFLKQKLPAPVASQIDGVLKGGGSEGMLGKLGGLLGKK